MTRTLQAETPVSGKIPPAALPRSLPAQLDWLRLFRSRRVGPATFIRMIRKHGSATEALGALPDVAAAAGVKGYEAFPLADAEREWEAALAHGAVPLLLGSPDYPPLLATAADAPPFLWAMGNIDTGQRPTVAIVGARNSSALGVRMATRIAAELGELGFVIASGLARGIDTAAHRASLETGTIAAQAGGIDVIYPKENTDLAQSIAEKGLRISEMPIGHDPRPNDFPRRNRIISGLAHGIVVVEGALKSGSLITARNALDQGREVMAIPGSPMDARAGGCNQLIRDGATLVRNAEDVAEALSVILTHGPQPRRQERAPELVQSSAPPATTGGTPDILSLLGPTPVPEDILVRQLGQPVSEVSAALADLEIAGQVRRHPGGLISLA
ncbi:DNA-processing protein DprA [Amaricoccus tamworthensis]|uniref:DNA-processing protein DprA n=1 Tax=Amaricoccus tamworthensis TaxID=57002 RepID=UPI003C7CB109